MNPAPIVRICLASFLLAFCTAPQPVSAHRLAARQKPGPTTIRGIAGNVSSHGFTLTTTAHGIYSVLLTPQTVVAETGKLGTVTVRNGDHVGVRGFVGGRTITAITVHIYPIEPKPYSLRGTIAGVQGNVLRLNASGKTIQMRMSGQTVVSIGRARASQRDMRVGDRADVRVVDSNGLQVLSIRITRPRVPERHVSLVGQVVRIQGNAVTVSTGRTSVVVTVAATTSFRLGDESAGLRDLRPGQTVTVHACCAGRPLAATSIRIRRVSVRAVTTTVRGKVARLTGSEIALSTAHGQSSITLTGATVYEIGSQRAARTSIRPGDDVSVRALVHGSSLTAERVHVYGASRRTRSLEGPVITVSSAAITVRGRDGKLYSVHAGPHVQAVLGGHAIPLSAVQRGDRLHASGELDGSTLTASRIEVTRSLPKSRTVHGSVASIAGWGLMLIANGGDRYTVRCDAHCSIRLHGQPLTLGALFPGEKVTVRGADSGSTLVATSVTAQVTVRTVHGRLTAASRGTLTLTSLAGSVSTVHLAPGTNATDSGRRVSPASLVPGAYVEVVGYRESSGAVRATTIQVLHPAVRTTATIVSTAHGLVVQTETGERWQLRFGSGTQIMGGTIHIPLSPGDLAVGAHIHVEGTVASDGSLAVTLLEVTLQSSIVRGTIIAVTGKTLTVSAGGHPLTVRPLPGMEILQGTHLLSMSGLVTGDDVSLYGYKFPNATIRVRKIAVHRHIATLDGVIAAITSDGFTVQAADGVHRVIVSAATIMTGDSAPAVAQTVHASGYLRGDGVLLATHVRIGTKR